MQNGSVGLRKSVRAYTFFAPNITLETHTNMNKIEVTKISKILIIKFSILIYCYHQSGCNIYMLKLDHQSDCINRWIL
jgi:hypothetical protein